MVKTVFKNSEQLWKYGLVQKNKITLNRDDYKVLYLVPGSKSLTTNYRIDKLRLVFQKKKIKGRI